MGHHGSDRSRNRGSELGVDMSSIFTMVSVLTMIVTVASLIAASTPTPKDDVWIGKIYKLVDLLALNIGKAKEK